MTMVSRYTVIRERHSEKWIRIYETMKSAMDDLEKLKRESSTENNFGFPIGSQGHNYMAGNFLRQEPEYELITVDLLTALNYILENK